MRSNLVRFFDEYPRFLETSRTGPGLDRLNARYTALIHENRELIDGATVLDLASHDQCLKADVILARRHFVEPRCVQPANELVAATIVGVQFGELAHQVIGDSVGLHA